MRYLVNYTGGAMVMCDKFTSTLFQQTFQRFHIRDANGHFKMGFTGQMEVKVFGLNRPTRVCK